MAESLRHVTEALGKQPDDAELVGVQRQLTDKLKAMETSNNRISSKSCGTDEYDHGCGRTAQESPMQPLEVKNKEAAAAAERVKSIEAQSQQLTAALDAARKAAQPVEAELAQAKQNADRWQNEIAFRDQIVALQTELEAARKVAAERQAEVEKRPSNFPLLKPSSTPQRQNWTRPLAELMPSTRKCKRLAVQSNAMWLDEAVINTVLS